MIMKPAYYNSLAGLYDHIRGQDLPQPKVLPMSAEEHDYKTYWTLRRNQERQKEEHLASGSVYLIDNKLGQVKIGKSTNVQQRLSGLEMGSGRKLKLLATYTPNNIKYGKLETMLHAKYKEYRGIGEWFDYKFTIQDWLHTCAEYDS